MYAASTKFEWNNVRNFVKRSPSHGKHHFITQWTWQKTSPSAKVNLVRWCFWRIILIFKGRVQAELTNLMQWAGVYFQTAAWLILCCNVVIVYFSHSPAKLKSIVKSENLNLPNKRCCKNYQSNDLFTCPVRFVCLTVTCHVTNTAMNWVVTSGEVRSTIYLPPLISMLCMRFGPLQISDFGETCTKYRKVNFLSDNFCLNSRKRCETRH